MITQLRSKVIEWVLLGTHGTVTEFNLWIYKNILKKTNWFVFKGVVHLKMRILSSFTYVGLNLFDLLSNVEQKQKV